MNRDNLDFGSGKIGSLFKAMFFPTLVGMLFNSALNVCDGMFVGHGVGSDGLRQSTLWLRCFCFVQESV